MRCGSRAIRRSRIWPCITRAALAVRYQLLLKDVVTTKGIENVLDVYVNDERAGTLAELADSAVSSGVLLAGSADRVQVQVHMQEQAGNAYQEAYASFAIEVFATQYTYETDGFGSDLYDEAAPLPAVHTQYDFDDPAQAVRFCPECQNSGSTAGDADHTQFAAAFEIRDGKAVIRNNTPHIAFNGLDWENSRYTLAYEVDASALSDGARVRFDAVKKPVGSICLWRSAAMVRCALCKPRGIRLWSRSVKSPILCR